VSHLGIRYGLEDIEKVYGVEIFYACESGSRMWGFPSPNSDYDIRFIYKHPVDWYLRVRNKRKDTITVIENDLDFHGWDLYKTLSLLKNSNPTLYEWYTSPIVYKSPNILFNDRFGKLANKYFSKIKLSYHYFHLAKGNYNKYIKGKNSFNPKRYLYVLRALLCVRWMIHKNTLPPTSIFTLLTMVSPKSLPIKSLIKCKCDGNVESFDKSNYKLLNEFIDNHVSLYNKFKFETIYNEQGVSNILDIDLFFKEMVL
jgi:hypothetical protein